MPHPSAHQILHDVFGFHGFRPGQEEIVERLASGQNTLAVMPTGAGKSLCYQIPALLGDRAAIIVSPLVALMDDQVAALRANGVAAACIHSGLPRDEQVAAWRETASGQCRLLYLSPERLMTTRMIGALHRLNPSMFVVDEAHCISKWGASFRPEYEQLSALCDLFPDSVIAGFTATADSATRADIAQKLFRNQGKTIVHGFDRPNLRLAAAYKSQWKNQLLQFLTDKREMSGIIYCLSRKNTEEVAEFLCESGVNAIAYHAGLDASTRKENQNRFMTENAVVMAATIAFGMGIDKPDIRYVCHLNLPGSMEAYYQEIGRAGRDGEPAETLLLYNMADMRQRRLFIDQENSESGHKLREHKRLDALMAYADAAQCRRRSLLAYFSEDSSSNGSCGNCDNCLSPPKLTDHTIAAQILFNAIRQTGESFGAAHVIDVVCGAQTQKIRERAHERLASYGTGSDKAKAWWQSCIRQLVSGNYLAIEIEKFGALRLTARGDAVIEGREAFALRESAPERAARPPSKSATAAKRMNESDAQLLADLKKRRMLLARERNVPAYVIFHDAVLMEMAQRRPMNMDAMSGINGIGPKKLQDFGRMFLDLIRMAA